MLAGAGAGAGAGWTGLSHPDPSSRSVDSLWSVSRQLLIKRPFVRRAGEWRPSCYWSHGEHPTRRQRRAAAGKRRPINYG